MVNWQGSLEKNQEAYRAERLRFHLYNNVYTTVI